MLYSVDRGWCYDNTAHAQLQSPPSWVRERDRQLITLRRVFSIIVGWSACWDRPEMGLTEPVRLSLALVYSLNKFTFEGLAINKKDRNIYPEALSF
jgi:hypothetical protein